MAVDRKTDIKDFARRVERLCDFLLANQERDGSRDFVVIENLREDAANLQIDRKQVASETFAGLYDFMNGVDS